MHSSCDPLHDVLGLQVRATRRSRPAFSVREANNTAPQVTLANQQRPFPSAFACPRRLPPSTRAKCIIGPAFIIMNITPSQTSLTSRPLIVSTVMRMPRTGRACYARDTIACIALQIDSDSPGAFTVLCLPRRDNLRLRCTPGRAARSSLLPSRSRQSDTLTRL